MTDADRKHLAAILGMLGSDSVGERAAAASKAEAFRRKHGATWAELVEGKTIYLDREVVTAVPVYIDRPVYRWPLFWRVMPALQAIAGLPPMTFDRGLAIALGSIPLIMILASLAPLIRQAFGY